MSSLSIKPLLASAVGAQLYHVVMDGPGNMALGISAVAASGSVLYDMMGTQALILTKMDVKNTRALFVFNSTLIGMYFLYPATTWQTRIIDAILASSAAYAMS